MIRQVTAALKADDNNAVNIPKGDLANGELAILWIVVPRQGTPSWPVGFTQVAETPVADSAFDEDVYIATKQITDAASEPSTYTVNMNMSSSIRDYAAGLVASSKAAYIGGYGGENFNSGSGYPFPQGDTLQDDVELFYLVSTGATVLDGTVSGDPATVLESGISTSGGSATFHTEYLLAANDQATQGTSPSLQVDSSGGGNVSMITALFAGAVGPAGPQISGVSGNDATETASLTVDTYTNVQSVTYGGTALTGVVEFNATTVRATMPKGGFAFGSSNDFQITDDNNTGNAFSAVFNPPTGWAFVTLSSEASWIPGTAAGDQIAYQTTAGGYTVSIAPDGTVTYGVGAPDGVSFQAYVLDASDTYAAGSTGTIVKGSPSAPLSVSGVMQFVMMGYA